MALRLIILSEEESTWFPPVPQLPQRLVEVEKTLWCQNGSLSENQGAKGASITAVAWLESAYIPLAKPKVVMNVGTIP